MNVHEYQAKELLHRYGVPVLPGRAVFNAADAGAVAFADFVVRGVKAIVIKAQIHAGGRGKGGGVKVAKSADEAAEIAGRMIKRLREEKICDGVHVMAIGREHLVPEILSAAGM